MGKESRGDARGVTVLTARGPATSLVAGTPDTVVIELAVTPSTTTTGATGVGVGVGDGATPRASTAT